MAAYANLQTPYGSTITYATVATAANGNAVCYEGSLLVATPGYLRRELGCGGWIHRM